MPCFVFAAFAACKVEAFKFPRHVVSVSVGHVCVCVCVFGIRFPSLSKESNVIQNASASFVGIPSGGRRQKASASESAASRRPAPHDAVPPHFPPRNGCVRRVIPYPTPRPSVRTALTPIARCLVCVCVCVCVWNEGEMLCVHWCVCVCGVCACVCSAAGRIHRVMSSSLGWNNSDARELVRADVVLVWLSTVADYSFYRVAQNPVCLLSGSPINRSRVNKITEWIYYRF
jgi:hypothetical protein